jgi:serine/threonine protein kinase/tetratricopeptide (TPR) repeat protein
MRERDIFIEALQKEGHAERQAYLAAECAGDPELRKRVEELLAEHQRAESFFLDVSPPGVNVTIDQPVVDRPGTQVGPYKLLQQIGEGGMGVVYMAEQSEPVERRVALKIIKPGMDTRQVIARFEAERQALAVMDHPNIAKVLDAGTTECGRPYFVMELVKGLPVTQYCDEQRLTPPERLELFLPICQAVQHAHQKGVIHRDLKPSNILVARYDDKAVPKVIDFGVAKAVSQRLTEKTMFTQYGQIVGTLEYMSPEQAQFNQLDVDTRSDIYSLGVLLYELLTGETPFDKQRLRTAAFDEMLRIIREEEPPRPSTRLSSSETLPSIATNRNMEPRKLSTLVRGELDWIVMKALEKDRGRRYETASAFAADVLHYLNDEAVVACPPSPGYRFRKFARRNRGAIVTASMVAASLIAGIVGTTWQAICATQERDRAVAAEERADREADRAGTAEREAREEAQRADHEAALAKTEAAIAKAVNEYLHNDLLGQANPVHEPNRDIKLRTVVDRAAERIKSRFADQPLVEAAIHSNFGGTYHNLGEYEKAHYHHQRAVQIRTAVLGRENEQTIRSMHNLIAVLGDQGSLDRAEKAYRELLEIERSVFGIRDEVTLTTMAGLGEALLRQNRPGEADLILRDALEVAEGALGADDPTTLVIMERLGKSAFRQGQFEEGENFFRKTLAGRQRSLGFEHPDTLNSMQHLGVAVRMQGRHEESEKFFRDAVEGLRRVVGPEHPLTLTAINSVGLNLIDRDGRYADAEMLFREALDAAQRALGPEHPATLQSITNLGVALAHQKRYAEAEKCWCKALDLRRTVSGVSHPDTVKVAENLVQLLDLRLETEEQLNQEQQASRAHTCRILGEVLEAQNRRNQAEDVLRRGLKIISRLDNAMPEASQAKSDGALLEAALKRIEGRQKPQPPLD